MYRLGVAPGRERGEAALGWGGLGVEAVKTFAGGDAVIERSLGVSLGSRRGLASWLDLLAPSRVSL